MKKRTIKTRATSKGGTWNLCVCLGAILLSISCACLEESPIEEPNKETLDEQGVVIKKVPIWEKDISERERVSTSVTPIFHQEKVMVPGSQRNNKGMLVALDTASGEEVWRWTDEVGGRDFMDRILSREVLNRKGNLVIYKENYKFCAVNLDKGTTLWKDQRKGSSHSDDVQIVGNHYYYSYELEENRDGARAKVLMRGDLFSPNFEILVEAPIEPIQLFEGFYGSLRQPLIYKNENQELCALLPFSENIDIYKSKSINNFISYNISNKRFFTKKVRLPDTVVVGVVDKPVKLKDVFVIAGDDYIYGVSGDAKEVIWTRRSFSGNRSDGTLFIKGYKNRLFAVNNTGSRSLTMELDPQTGKTLWIDVGNGGHTRPAMCFLNDVLYFASRGDGRLYAYDINTGKMLWKLRGPDDERFTVMQVRKAEKPGETDMLVACTWKNAYRFKPAR